MDKVAGLESVPLRVNSTPLVKFFIFPDIHYIAITSEPFIEFQIILGFIYLFITKGTIG